MHMKAKGSAGSSDEIAVFQAYIDLIDSERDTIWARHNALLVANSLIIGAARHQSHGPLGEQMGGSCHAECRPPPSAPHGSGSRCRDGRRCDGMLVLLGPLLTCFTHLPNPFGETICNRAQTPDLLPNLAGDPRFVLMYLGPGYIHLSLG
jgi:hypothetical protein